MIEELASSAGGARTIAIALLVAARVAPLAFLAPWLAVRGTPPALRVALIASLTVAMTPIALATTAAPPGDALTLVLAIARELALGAAFAIACAVPLHALEQAGRIVDALRGASSADATLPSGARSSALGALHGMLGVALFLALGGHRLVIAALGASWIDLPPGAPLEGADLALGAARIVVSSLTLAVALAAPAAVSLVIVELAIGLVARTAPAMPVHFTAMPLRAGAGLAAVLLGLAVVLPRLAGMFASAIDAASSLIGG